MRGSLTIKASTRPPRPGVVQPGVAVLVLALMLATAMASCGGEDEGKDEAPQTGIILSVGALNFGDVLPGPASAAQTWTLSGNTLTADVMITAPQGMELSDDGTTWADNLVVPHAGGSVAPVTLSARVKAAEPFGPLASPIVHSSTGVASRNLAVMGRVDPGPRAPLPAQWLELDYFFSPELIAGNFTGANHDMPVKLAQAPAPDNRLFVSVLDGTILAIDMTPPYAQTVWANIAVLGGAEQGLLGIAVSPGFAGNGHVFVMACVAGVPDRQQIIRLTDSGGVGINPTVIVDNLPVAQIHNGGALKFGTDGMLFATVGDVDDENNPQASGVLAGRVLRFDETGAAPADNPLPAPNQFEWARGLRNTFGLCVHQGSGILVGTENGPNVNDELNYLRSAKNFEWGALSPVPGAQVGYRMRLWPAVIVPTGVTYHTGATFPQGYANNLFLCSYDENELLRFEMSGTPPVDIDAEHSFGHMVSDFNANKPLDIIQANDGSLCFSTFTAIWRIFKRTGP